MCNSFNKWATQVIKAAMTVRSHNEKSITRPEHLETCASKSIIVFVLFLFRSFDFFKVFPSSKKRQLINRLHGKQQILRFVNYEMNLRLNQDCQVIWMTIQSKKNKKKRSDKPWMCCGMHSEINISWG